MRHLDEARGRKGASVRSEARAARDHGKRGGRPKQAIRINKQWRVCFRWDKGDAYDVEITDYH